MSDATPWKDWDDLCRNCRRRAGEHRAGRDEAGGFACPGNGEFPNPVGIVDEEWHRQADAYWSERGTVFEPVEVSKTASRLHDAASTEA